MKIGSFTNSHSIFANIYSYMGRPLTRDPDEADVFVIGLPYDLGTSGRSGTRSGPRGIRAASSNLRWEEKRWPWDFNVFERLRIADYGRPLGFRIFLSTVKFVTSQLLVVKVEVSVLSPHDEQPELYQYQCLLVLGPDSGLAR